ncbi:PpiC-type peptidyl-prolyl cis-trans isomerase [Spirochaeta thermophila DSM 6578]|uniref:PpiC-type peptidyl-prolyl cis-trans isomerase n=1 Tax=Winmispira thermophila (strain ATCC 700085 / DSM 6578 / Z-1203) TaxID=869211 RepID=G0GED7_WINT7|nr:peptidylprolyl isomerase [Spirochaeta thermophila]AEJ62274.1 PpiC-type peptidyl-prolyl cis-trans isomerase [Spirochaeta thermophila DSM 6578]
MKTRTIVCVLAALVLAVFPACAGGKGEPKGGETEEVQAAAPASGEAAARVNGEEVPSKEVEREVQRYVAQYQQYGMEVSPEEEQKLREQVLDVLIGRLLLLQEAKRMGLSVDQAQVDAQIEQYKLQSGSEETFKNILAQAGYTEEEFREELSRAFLLQQVVDEKVTKHLSVSDEEARAYYDENPEQFEQPEQIRARHILIRLAPDASKEEEEAAYAKIHEVQEKLNQGADFAELAKTYSEGPSAPNGGDLGFFGKGQMVPAFEEAAFALEVNQVSDVVRTEYGLHLIQVTDRQEAGKASFEEVKDQLKEMLLQQKSSEAINALVEELKGKAEIEIY